MCHFSITQKLFKYYQTSHVPRTYHNYHFSLRFSGLLAKHQGHSAKQKSRLITNFSQKPFSVKKWPKFPTSAIKPQNFSIKLYLEGSKLVFFEAKNSSKNFGKIKFENKLVGIKELVEMRFEFLFCVFLH